MNKLFKRFIAYTIDMLVILIIAESLSGIPQINKQLNNYNKYSKEYYETLEDYIYFKDYLNNDLDKELTEEDYNDLLDKYPEYKEIIDKRYDIETITEKESKELAKEADNIYNELTIKGAYKVEKNNILYFCLYIIAVVAYFVGFNKYTGGQTLGKKLMRLKIVNNKDNNKGVPVWSYIVRMLILYQPINYLIKLIGINFLDMNTYFDVTSFVSTIQSYMEMLVIIFAIIRVDGRGIHDILANTRVMAYDRYGNEKKDRIEILASDIKKKKVYDSENLIDEEVGSDEIELQEESTSKKKTRKISKNNNDKKPKK